MDGARILNVAEKPSLARSIASILSGGPLNARDGYNKYCKNFDFTYTINGRAYNMVMTSVLGHLTEDDFPSEFRSWASCSPSALFEAPIDRTVAKSMRGIERNLLQEAQRATQLFIWTDCDREGENIGGEIAQTCRKANRDLIVRRPRFSVINAREIHRACQQPSDLDMRLVQAVNARRELDLRIGAAFTRFQTLRFQRRYPQLGKHIFSYGGCQFPTLGFVVDRYLKVENFVPEPFWKIVLRVDREDTNVDFLWRRVQLFDRLCCLALFETCVEQPVATVQAVRARPVSKRKPLPLTTVELQKSATRLLNMTSDQAMTAAEALYTRGIISYPRTETDRFDKTFPFRAIIEKQGASPVWGSFAQELLDGGFREPRQGKNDDRAHPPIHPTGYATNLSAREQRIFEFVTRRFLACCAEDARGRETSVEVDVSGERFWTKGVIVDARNYLNVYIYEKWNTRLLPNFVQGETFTPTELTMKAGRTSAPSMLREADLIALMDANGIGTDATIHEHIRKILDRSYVFKQSNFFYPSTLGIGLVRGYDRVDLEHSLTKPLLRRQMEQDMSLICVGERECNDVVQSSLFMYRNMYANINAHARILDEELDRYLGNTAAPH